MWELLCASALSRDETRVVPRQGPIRAISPTTPPLQSRRGNTTFQPDGGNAMEESQRRTNPGRDRTNRRDMTLHQPFIVPSS